MPLRIAAILNGISERKFFLTLVNCEWGDYSGWTECNASCGGGIQRRRRQVKIRARNGGRACTGATIETRPCNTEECSGMFAIVSTSKTFLSKVICSTTFVSISLST